MRIAFVSRGRRGSGGSSLTPIQTSSRPRPETRPRTQPLLRMLSMAGVGDQPAVVVPVAGRPGKHGQESANVEAEEDEDDQTHALQPDGRGRRGVGARAGRWHRGEVSRLPSVMGPGALPSSLEVSRVLRERRGPARTAGVSSGETWDCRGGGCGGRWRFAGWVRRRCA